MRFIQQWLQRLGKPSRAIAAATEDALGDCLPADVVVFDPATAPELIPAGWGPAWPNASTLLPALFTPSGGFNLSQYDDPAYNAKVDAAKVELDRSKQATQWQELNTEAM